MVYVGLTNTGTERESPVGMVYVGLTNTGTERALWEWFM